MKQYRYILPLVFAAICLIACQKEESGYTAGEGEFVFSPVIQTPATSRAVGNDFFTEGNIIDIQIITKDGNVVNPGETYQYKYGSDGVFRGTPEGFRFPLNDQYIATLTATWPTEEWKDKNERKILTDQRELENFRSSDWLEATATIEGLMPTLAPVPLTFEHKNCILEFQLAGQTVNDLKIHSLVLELIVEGKETAFWAYCENENGFAELILAPGIEIKANDSYMIGRAQIKDKNGNLTSQGIIIPPTNLTLKAGYKYLVTLTASGYDLTASIRLGGWGQTDHGIGVPFQQPVPNDQGEYLINTPAQLITTSYLIRHYLDSETIQWHRQTYILSAMPDQTELAEWYSQNFIPIPRDIFSGKFIRDNQEIDHINYYDLQGKEWPIYFFE